jgi:hypothetical protein
MASAAKERDSERGVVSRLLIGLILAIMMAGAIGSLWFARAVPPTTFGAERLPSKGPGIEPR